MKLRNQKILLLLLFCFLVFKGKSQNQSETVTITCTGDGTSQVKAKESALRDALQQAFGAFISSNTELLNLQIIKDEIATVTNGSIQDYSVLNETQLKDGQWISTVKVTVSVNKLVSFAQSKGIEVSFKGGLFAVNIQQKILNEQSEVIAIENTIKILDNIALKSFDYSISAGEPKSIDGKLINWKIPLSVTVNVNENFSQIPLLLIQTLGSLSLNKNELDAYKESNVNYFIVNIMRPTRPNNDFQHFYLRSTKSIKAIENFIRKFQFYLTNFRIDDGLTKRQISSFDPEVIYFPTYTDGARLKEDNFKIVTFMKNNNYLTTPSLFNVQYEKMYLPDLKYEGLHGTSSYNIIGVDCNCMGDIFSNSGGLILQFNKVSSKNKLVLLFKVLDSKNIDEIQKVQKYSINNSQ
jgi:hypothetical protein